MNRPFKPENFPELSPYLTVQSAEEAIAFYVRAFGFKVDNDPMMQDGRIMHAELSREGAKILVAPEGAFGGTTQAPKTSRIQSPIGLYIYVKDVDQFYKNAVENGAESSQEPMDTFWGDRMCRLKDSNGYQWNFATNISDYDPTKAPC